jgi:S1-C subfamily serine protease
MTTDDDGRRRLVSCGCAVVAALGAVVGCGGGSKSVGGAGSGVPPQTFAQVASGVGLVEDLDCRGRPLSVSGHRVTGTGFLVGSRVVLTAEHGVWVGEHRRACRMRVRLGDRSYDVVGVKVWADRGKADRRGVDLATLRLSRPASGHVFEVARSGARVGSAVAALGYPLGLPLSFSQGLLAKKIVDYGEPTLAARMVIEGGNSGGPIVDSRGQALGVVQRIVVYANLTTDGTTLWGGIDLARWWGASARTDLCRAYPDGGIPDCDPSKVGPTTKLAIPLTGSR